MKDSNNTNFLDAFENAFPDTGFVLDETGTIVRTFAGPEMDVLLIEGFSDAVGKSMEDVFRESTAETLRRQIDKTLETQTLQTSTYVIETEAGAHSFEGRMAPVHSGDTTPMVVALFRDITSRDLYAQYLDEKNRIIHTIQESTQAVSRARSVPNLYESICDVITTAAPYQFAWIGRVDAESGEIVPENSASGGESYMSTLDLGLSDDDAESQPPPAIEAVKTEEPAVVQSIYASRTPEPWRRAALKEGFDSAAAFPIFDTEQETIRGVLSVYAQRPYAFDFSERQLFEELCRDIAFTERALFGRKTITKQKEALLSRNAEWEILNRIIRHDIRNKMAVVLGYAELIEESVDGDDAEHLRKIQQSSQAVIEITKEARDVAQALASEDDIALEEIDLRTSLQTEVSQVHDVHPEASVAIEGEIPAVTVVANDFLSSVFRNVLANAVIHNDADEPTVTVTATATDETVTVDIADNGPGIPADVRRAIAAPDVASLSETDDGHGIGLRLVSSLVTQYDGELEITDNEPRGTVVSITLQQA